VHIRLWGVALVFGVALTLGACASGGNNSSVGSTGSSTPPPPPPPPPPATQTLGQALSGSPDLTNNAASIQVALSTPAGVVQNGTSQSPSLTVHYDAASAAYTLTLGSGSESFAASDLQTSSTAIQSVYEKSNTDSLNLFAGSPTSGKSYVYGGMGAWQQNTTSGSVQNTTFTTFAFGLQTPAAAVPRTGAAEFDVDVVGAVTEPGQAPLYIGGPGDFDVDFLSGVFSLSATTNQTNVVSEATTTGGIYVTGAGHLSSTGATFSGTSSFWDSSYNLGGPMSGRFYGPNGQELGGSFSGSDNNGGTMAGSFYGTQSTTAPSSNLTLTNLIADQRFSTLGQVLEIGNGTGGVVVDISSQPGGISLQQNTDGTFTTYPAFSNETRASFTAANKVASPLPNFTTYQTTVVDATSGDSEPTEVEAYNVGASNSELALTYTSLGIWRQSNIAGNNEQDTIYYVYGIQTPQTIVQHLTGQGQYSGVVYGGAVDGTNGQQFNLTGSSTFDVNFSSQSFTGGFNLNGTGMNGAPNRNLGAFNFTGQIGYSQNTGVITQAGSNVGSLALLFNGPAAEELGASFQAVVGGNGAALSSTYISGVMAAKKN
jgi:hypothetical protein